VTFLKSASLNTSAPFVIPPKGTILTETYNLKWTRAAEAILTRWVPAGWIKHTEEEALTSLLDLQLDCWRNLRRASRKVQQRNLILVRSLSLSESLDASPQACYASVHCTVGWLIAQGVLKRRDEIEQRYPAGICCCRTRKVS